MAPEREEDRGQKLRLLRERFDGELNEVDQKIARLRVLYDQYFMGIEKLEPHLLRSELNKYFMRSAVPLRGSTVQKFKYRSLQQRFTSYCSYWERICRLIEEGRIRRGVVNPGELRFSGTPAPQTPETSSAQPAPEVREELPEALIARRRRFRKKAEDDPGQHEAGPPDAAATMPPGPRPATGDEFLPSDIDGLFSRLLSEKTRVGEKTDGLRKELLEKSVQRILDKVGDKPVRLKVIEKDGRVSVAALLKKD